MKFMRNQSKMETQTRIAGYQRLLPQQFLQLLSQTATQTMNMWPQHINRTRPRSSARRSADLSLFVGCS
jgi:hypothetical protein